MLLVWDQESKPTEKNPRRDLLPELCRGPEKVPTQTSLARNGGLSAHRSGQDWGKSYR